MEEIQEKYFKTDSEWRNWLHSNHNKARGIYLIFYKVGHEAESMRWEDAVKVAPLLWLDRQHC